MNSIEELRAIGAFVNGAPVVKRIVFTINGQEYDATVHVRRRSLGEQERIFQRTREQKDPRAAAATIATLVHLGENGEETLTIDDAAALHPALADAMLAAIHEVETGPKA